MRAKPALCACLLALGLAGCGTADRERDAAAVAERFHAALEARDGEAACAELNPETASKLEQQEKKPCEDAILALELSRGGTVVDAHVYVTSAFAQRAEGGKRLPRQGPRRLDRVCRRLRADRPRAALRMRAGGLTCARCSTSTCP